MESDANPHANKLNRELLRWIQSLDLAYSIKNVKRDFSNGFLVAEIMSRYYDKDISMHSYDNGIGIKVKKDNWDQLSKFFNRFPDLEQLAAKSDIDAIIHCQNGAAVAFLTKLYTCLTKRTIQTTVAVPAPSSSLTSTTGSNAPPVAKARDPIQDIPPYAKPTGSAIIRDKMRAPDIAEMRDETEVNRKVRDIHAQYEETLQLERLAMDSPDRYASSLRSGSKATVLRGATKPVRNDDNPMLMTQHVVKEVQIKSINEKNLEKLRVTREAKENDAHASSDSYGSRGTLSINGSTSSMSEHIQKRKPLDLLNEIVARKLTAMDAASRLDQRAKGKFESFIESIHAGQPFSDQDYVDVFTEVTDAAAVLASAFLDVPKEFWKFTGLLFPLLTEHDDEHPVFQAIHASLLHLGSQTVKRDGMGAALLMTENLLPKITSSLCLYETKRTPFLQLVYAFVPNQVLAHIQTIKRLREALPDDIPLFIHALSTLLYMEKELDDTLIDLYHYYCCIGLETPCEKLRAACLSMLVPFLAYDTSLVVDLLPRLTQYSSRQSWWEVKVQLLIVASAFLDAVVTTEQQESEHDLTEQIELCLTIIEREFYPSANLNLRRLGLAHLAKNLAAYQELVPLYVDVLFSLPPTVRYVMLRRNTLDHPHFPEDGDTPELEVRNELPIRGTTGVRYELMQLPLHWDSVAIAKQIYYERKTDDHADFETLNILHSCFEQLSVDGQYDPLCMLYDQLAGYLLLGLLDAGGCILSSRIISYVVMASPSSHDIFKHEAFIDVLQKLVSKNVDDIRQQTAVKILRDAHDSSSQLAANVQQCIHTLRSVCDSVTFRASLFAIALDGTT